MPRAHLYYMYVSEDGDLEGGAGDTDSDDDGGGEDGMDGNDHAPLLLPNYDPTATGWGRQTSAWPPGHVPELSELCATMICQSPGTICEVLTDSVRLPDQVCSQLLCRLRDTKVLDDRSLAAFARWPAAGIGAERCRLGDIACSRGAKPNRKLTSAGIRALVAHPLVHVDLSGCVRLDASVGSHLSHVPLGLNESLPPARPLHPPTSISLIDERCVPVCSCLGCSVL